MRLIRLTLKLGLAAGIGLFIGQQILRRRRIIQLAGRTVLITGGSRGLGLALAREFTRHGARVAICARNADDLSRAEADLKQIGGDVRTYICDLTEPAQIAKLIDSVETDFSGIDILVNNAATITVGPIQAMNLQDFQKAMDIGFWPAVHTALAVAPRMRGRHFGRIVNIASIGGKAVMPHLTPYCASKFALVGLSGGMRAELARDGILVTTINPGLMRTGSPRNAEFKGNPEVEYAWFSASDSLPGLSMSAPKAARKIVTATIYGDAEVTLGLPAKIAATLYGLLPNLHLESAALINRAFPLGDGQTKLGRDSESWFTRLFITPVGRAAEQNLNQKNS